MTDPFTDIRAVAFDCFGTLLEIRRPANPWRRILAAASPPGAGSHPDPRREPLSLREFAAACGVEFRPEWEAELAEELASIAPWPGARGVMARLRRAGLPLALASNLAAPYVPRVRELLGDLADVTLFSCEARLVKPEPAFFRTLCHRLDLPPGQVLMVGDSLASDVLGAQGVGMPAVQLWPAEAGEAGPGRIARLEELPGILGMEAGGEGPHRRRSNSLIAQARGVTVSIPCSNSCLYKPESGRNDHRHGTHGQAWITLTRPQTFTFT